MFVKWPSFYGTVVIETVCRTKDLVEMIPDLVATEQGLVWVVSRASVTLQPVLEDETPVLLVGVV